jgi:hypothetical protein
MNNRPSGSAPLFKGRHFDSSIIIPCVRWFITYKSSYRDLREMMAERGIDLAHTTILRWVQRYVSELKRSGIASPVQLAPPGGSMRLTSAFAVNGSIFIGRLISMRTRLTFG